MNNIMIITEKKLKHLISNILMEIVVDNPIENLDASEEFLQKNNFSNGDLKNNGHDLTGDYAEFMVDNGIDVETLKNYPAIMSNIDVNTLDTEIEKYKQYLQSEKNREMWDKYSAQAEEDMTNMGFDDDSLAESIKKDKKNKNMRLNETQLKKLIKESIKKVYDIDNMYSSEIGNRSQYAPDDIDAEYSYEHPGELSMAAQGSLEHMTGDDRPTRWARSKKFASIKESKLNESIKKSIKKVLKEDSESGQIDYITRCLDRAGIEYDFNNELLFIFWDSNEYENQAGIYKQISDILYRFGWDLASDEEDYDSRPGCVGVYYSHD